jgi:hypothetical protein
MLPPEEEAPVPPVLEPPVLEPPALDPPRAPLPPVCADERPCGFEELELQARNVTLAAAIRKEDAVRLNARSMR